MCEKPLNSFKHSKVHERRTGVTCSRLCSRKYNRLAKYIKDRIRNNRTWIIIIVARGFHTPL